MSDTHGPEPQDRTASSQASGRRRLSRRGFLQTSGVLGAGALGLAPSAFAQPLTSSPLADAIGPRDGSEREVAAFQRRFDAALYQFRQPVPVADHNTDEEVFASRVGNFTKTMPHDALGEVVPGAYDAFLAALSSGAGADFDGVPAGGVRRLANPRAAYSFTLDGPDGHKVEMPPIYGISDARQASEAAEVYWKAAARDVEFDNYSSDPITNAAAADLSTFSDFVGPREGGAVTPGTLFRGVTPQDLVGPYISQFLFLNVPYGNRASRQAARNPLVGQDFMTSFDDWLAIQNGEAPTAAIALQSDARFIQTGRDLSEYVHRDFTYQSYLNASLIGLSYGAGALDPNPYSISMREGGFVTYGPAFVWDLVGRAATTALKVSWFHKWLVHRKVRPEAFGGLVHNTMTGAKSYPLPPELLDSPVLDLTFSAHGTYLLPQAFPEGSPTHPSYPAGHAVIAGACVTVLKAIFDEDFVLPQAVVPTEDGARLRLYTDEALTLGGELNKLANNIAIGRNIAGVHWRADGDEGVIAGETAAILLLQDVLRTLVEDNAAFTLRRFDGVTILITPEEVTEL